MAYSHSIWILFPWIWNKVEICNRTIEKRLYRYTSDHIPVLASINRHNADKTTSNTGISPNKSVQSHKNPVWNVYIVVTRWQLLSRSTYPHTHHQTLENICKHFEDFHVFYCFIAFQMDKQVYMLNLFAKEKWITSLGRHPPYLTNVKIILHRIISVVWLTDFLSEIWSLINPRWWARPLLLSMKRQGVNTVFNCSDPCIDDCLFSDLFQKTKGEVAVWVVSCLLWGAIVTHYTWKWKFVSQWNTVIHYQYFFNEYEISIWIPNRSIEQCMYWYTSEHFPVSASRNRHNAW